MEDKNYIKRIINPFLWQYLSHFFAKQNFRKFIAITFIFFLFFCFLLLLQSNVYKSKVLLSDTEPNQNSLPSSIGSFGFAFPSAIKTNEKLAKINKIIGSYSFFSYIKSPDFLRHLMLVKGESGNDIIYTSKDISDFSEDDLYSKYLKTVTTLQDDLSPFLEVHISSLSASSAHIQAQYIIKKLDEYMRFNELEFYEIAINSLEERLVSTNLPELRIAIAEMLKSYVGKQIIAQQPERFSFIVIDGPNRPLTKSGPFRLIQLIQLMILYVLIFLIFDFLSFSTNKRIVFRKFRIHFENLE